jgi:O-antigen ligase
MFLEHPVLGVGGGNFTDNNALTAHNSFVLVLAETGYVGFTIWFAFVTYCFWMMIAVMKHQPELADSSAQAAWASEQSIARTLLFSLCGFFAAAFFLSRSYAILLYVLTALVVGYYTGVRKRYPALPEFSLQKDAVRWPMISIGVIVGLYLVIRTLVLAE